jgi:hypothetical protein
MTKLHELLAVETDVKASTQAIVSETMTVFKKDEHFSGFQKTYHAWKEDGDRIPPESKPQVTTVVEKLEHTHKAWGRLIDIIYQKDVANSQAFGPLEIGGVVISENVPATTLLTLESKLKQLKEVYLAAPTLDPLDNWYPNENRAHSYKTAENVTYRTARVLVPQILVPATDKHPAQVEKVVKDEQCGEYHSVKYSGKLAPRTKAELLRRIDVAIAEVKTARCRANEVEVTKNLQIADEIINYLTYGLS